MGIIGSLRILLLLAVCVGVVQLGRQTGAFLAGEQEGTVETVIPQPIDIAEHMTAPLSTSRKDSSLTRSLRVPEDTSKLSSTLGQVAQTVGSTFGWRTSPHSSPVTPRKLNIPAGSVRHFDRVAALHRAASARDDVTPGAADVTLGDVVTKLLNPGARLGDDSAGASTTSEKPRRSLAQTPPVPDGLGLSVRVVSVLNVRSGQLGSVTVELVDENGIVVQQAEGLELDWGGSFLLGPTGGKVVLGRGLEIRALQKGVAVVTSVLQEVGDYTLQLVLNNQAAASIPVTVFPKPVQSNSIKTAASVAAQSSQTSTRDTVTAPKPKTWATISEKGNDFPGWPWLVGGVSFFLVASAIGVAIFAVHLQRKHTQQARGERTADLQAGGAEAGANESEGVSKAVPDSLENSGEITGPQAFLWAVQETGGPGLDQIGQKTGGVRRNRTTGKNSPRLLSMAVQKLREKNLEAAKKGSKQSGEDGRTEVFVEGKNQAGDATREMNRTREDPVEGEPRKEGRPVKHEAEETEVVKGAVTEGADTSTVRNGATLRTEKEDDTSDGTKTVRDSENNEGENQVAGRRRESNLPVLSGDEAASVPSPQGGHGSALWSPLTFSVPSAFAERPPSRKRRSLKGDPPKSRTPKSRKASIFAPKKANEPKRTKQTDRELWSPVRFVSPPIAKPGKIRRTEGAETGEKGKFPPETETRRALTFRPTPLDIPGATGPLKQSALWSPVKTFGTAQPVDVLNVSENRAVARGPGVAVLAGGKENALGARKLQPTRFKSAAKETIPLSKEISVKAEEKEEHLTEGASDLATPSGSGPSLWSPTFNELMETEATPEAMAAKSDSGGPVKELEQAPRGVKRMAGRATLSSTSGAEIAALLQELERRTAGQAGPLHTLSPYTAYEKLVAEERKKKRSDNRARFLSLGGDEMLGADVVSPSELDSPQGVTMSYDVAQGDDDVTLSAFVEV
ncbi:hypothetical protein KFL_000170160 [Klebsormidium nitens]|uniref:Transmembrane protein n=1 Tax=Klebsormidium nitens TaxID=105231 RepID=A0A1Y1HJF9_KLENI|nr:hypothetical protein KFL_000170160 [Klebsormidium nitens]|eukprot:GAQ78670.1 hypothetical protein KFL_000170160 [Klebsormidium nitens]